LKGVFRASFDVEVMHLLYEFRGEELMTLKRKATNNALLFSMLLSVAGPLFIGLLLLYYFPQWRWSHDLVHTMTEGVGSIAAFVIAAAMVITVNNDRLDLKYYWPATALIGMGILDGFHAVTHIGNNFVWLHSIATLLGGLIFSAIWLPESWLSKKHWWYLVTGVIPLSITLGVWSIFFSDAVPLMVIDGTFTPLARTINSIGGFTFLLGSAHFVHEYINTKKSAYTDITYSENIVFANHCMLFGVSGLLFEFSTLWDIGWWWWHLLRMMAYLVVLVYFLLLLKSGHVLLMRQKGEIEEASDVNQAKDDFLASMSHELRTPLTSILGYSDLLADSAIDPEQRGYIKSIRTAGEGQLALVNDILDMSKIESGNFTIDKQPYSLKELISGVQLMLSVKAEDAAIQLNIESLNREQFQLSGDYHRIKQVLINLIGNSIKFTEKGSVTLTTEVQEGQLLFRVTDTGIGIKPENMDRLFGRFQQEDGSISRRFGGSGLGLFISRRLAELMGGELTSRSTFGKGSTFTLTLPYQVTDIPEASDQTVEEKTREAEMIGGSVLVVEDTPELQLLIRKMLEKMGASVEVADNGAIAVERASQHTYDLILMDMQMPVMDGIEATRRICDKHIQTPVLAMTANVMQKHREQFATAGCAGFLGKPIDKELLRKALKQFVFNKKRGLEEDLQPIVWT